MNIEAETKKEALEFVSEKAEELNSSLLYTEDDAVTNLKEKLVAAVELLNADIESLKNNVATANNNKKW